MKTNKFFLLIIIAIVIFAMEIFAQTPPKPQVTGWEKYYTVQPDIANCNSGTIKDSVRQQFLDYINLVRRIHNLGELAYDYNQNDVVAKAALMSVANGSLNTPAPGWECYDANAAATDPKNGIYMMNINDASYDATPEDALRFLLFSENVTYQGQYVLLYRRAILNPFLHYISYGRCDGKPKVQYQYQNVCTQILQFLLNDNDATDFAGDFVAYPFQDYPTDLFDKAFYLSFFVVHDKTGWRNNGGVDYSATTIEVKDELNNTMTVTNKESDNLAFTQGNLHNSLRWKVTGLATTTRYNVTIRNVKINGNARDYTYWFDLNNRNLPVPQTPTLISPANSEQYAGKALKLTWNAVKYAQYYRLMVSKQSDFSSDVIVNEVKLDKPSFDLSGLEVNVNYFWKVQAFSDAGSSNWTPVWGFRAGIPAPETVILNDPPDNATFLGTNVRLKWNIASHSDSYQIQLSKSSDFTSDVAVDVENINATSYDAKNLEENIKFYWRVRGKNEGGFGQWSSVWNFTSNFQAPAIPTLLTPLNNSQGVEINPVLKWNPADRAQSYHIIVSKTSDFSGDIVIDKDNIINTLYPMPFLDADITYYWKVQAVNIGGASQWTDPWSFKTALAVPGRPNLVFPPSAKQNTSLTLTLIWNRAPNATSYKVMIATTQFFEPENMMLNEQNILDTTYTISSGVLEKNTQYFWKIASVNSLGTIESAPFRFRTGDGITGISEITVNSLQNIYNYPNPFSHKTNFVFHNPNSCFIKILIFNSLGEQISTVFDGYTEKGDYLIDFDASLLNSGTYFYKLIAGAETQTGIMQIVK